jgi:hypothetical protein
LAASDHADRRENCVTALTLEEARERSRLLDVRAYHVELDVTGGGEAFGSVTVVRFGCRAPGAGSFIELSPARLPPGPLRLSWSIGASWLIWCIRVPRINRVTRIHHANTPTYTDKWD